MVNRTGIVDNGTPAPKWAKGRNIYTPFVALPGLLTYMSSRLDAALQAALPLDGVYIASHGASSATGDEDSDGTLVEQDFRDSVYMRGSLSAALEISPRVAALVRGLEAAGVPAAAVQLVQPPCAPTHRTPAGQSSRCADPRRPVGAGVGAPAGWEGALI